jgi:hypothetical protein
MTGVGRVTRGCDGQNEAPALGRRDSSSAVIT